MEHKDDDDDDDDVSFAKWMSSFWGHSWIEEDERGVRDRRGSRDASYRKSSLPCPFPVLPRMMSSASHPRRYSYEDQGFRCHTQVRDHRKCSGDGSFKEPLESKGRSHSKIQSFSDSFEQQLCFRTKRSVSLEIVCDRIVPPVSLKSTWKELSGHHGEQSRSGHSGLVGIQVRHKEHTGRKRGKNRSTTDDAKTDT